MSAERKCRVQDKGAEISFHRVSKVYSTGGSRVDALRDVTFEMGRGDYMAIMGPSGSGKSTLLHLMGCLDRPSSGSVKVRGEDTRYVTEAGLSRLRGRHIGFVFQSFELLGWATAQENVEMPLLYQGVPPGERCRRARAALEKVGLDSRTDHKPSELSGGEQQRVAIARAVVHSPAVVLADEPTGNLDSRSGELIMELLASLSCEGLSIALITHDPGVAARASRLLHLADGRIIGVEGSG